MRKLLLIVVGFQEEYMQYLISDIHGNLRDFKRLLNKIAFDSKKDILIILGVFLKY